MITMTHFLALSMVLFGIGVAGVVSRRNAIIVLMGIELMLNAANINFVAFARFMPEANLIGQIFTVFVITVAAGEVAVGLAIIIALYRNKDSINLSDFNILRG
jgi:NADH-quinone oxidoreductase subunit K